MPIPTYQDIYKPLLTLTSDGKTRTVRQIRDDLALTFSVSDDEMAQLLPSGAQKVWDSRVGWAKTYLVKAGLIQQPKRGLVEIADRGRQVLQENPEVLDDKFLLKYPEFREFYAPGSSNNGQEQTNLPVTSPETAQTPQELIESAYQQVRQQVEVDMLERIMAAPPNFLEQLVVDLLLKMGYGGSRADAGRAIGQSGDGGIDGIIKEDKLGLDTLYIQAKRWQGSVGRPEVQRFAGALHGQRAKKGIMITTSSFTREAHEYANTVETKIVLLDGKHLTRLMFDHGLGCTSLNLYDVKKVDSDYFEFDTGTD